MADQRSRCDLGRKLGVSSIQLVDHQHALLLDSSIQSWKGERERRGHVLEQEEGSAPSKLSRDVTDIPVFRIDKRDSCPCSVTRSSTKMF